MPLTEVEVEGTPKVFMDDDTVSGNTVARRFCGSPIYVVVGRAPTTAYFTSGTLDHTDDLVPKCQGWTSTKHEWVTISDGAPEYHQDPGLQPEEV